MNTKKVVNRLSVFSVFILLISVNFANAAQERKVSDGDSVQVNISSRELTRITIKGDTRIKKIWGDVGGLEIKPDLETGEGYIIPKPGSKAALSFFVQDDNGSTYTIIAKQVDVPSETIILKPKVSRKSVRSQFRSLKNSSYVENIKSLMKAMARGEPLSDYIVEDVNEEVLLWKETDISMIVIYEGYDFVGEVYLLKNISDEKMHLAENEFLDFGENVKAVAIEESSLEHNEDTFIYVVRFVGGE